MLNWSMIFLLAALVSALFAMSDRAGGSADVAELMVFFFVAVPAVGMILRKIQETGKDDDDDLGHG